ncbi:MAG: FkbM family methyltransferase [Candidatus Sumerlaeota bacterium]|nr:FkbM family methyltransferase [Candidatus Sumerlaeota bacterium]
MSEDSSPAPSFVLSAVASLARAVSLPTRVGVLLLRALARLGLSPFARVAVGPYALDLDVRHPFHLFMILRRYEREAEALYRRVLRPGDVYVDVGAEVGYLAAVAGGAVGPAGRMLLFEPDPRICPRLRAHMDSAPRDQRPKTAVVDRACSDRRQAFEMELAPLSGQSLLVQWDADHVANPTAAVSSVILDQQLEEQGIESIRLLKMDVEGHEVFALKGLGRSLQQRRIDFLLVEKNEWLLSRNGFSSRHLHAALARHGYVGVHEDGAAISRESLGRAILENLVYARTHELMREAFPAYPRASKESGFSNEEIEELWAAIEDAGELTVQANILIDRAGRGFLAESIEKGRRLLEDNPARRELLHFRGHLAHWLLATGRRDEARAHYQRIVEENPADPEAARILRSIDEE